VHDCQSRSLQRRESKQQKGRNTAEGRNMEHAHGQTHPGEHCKEEQGAEFNTTLGTGFGSNGKDSWMYSITAV